MARENAQRCLRSLREGRTLSLEIRIDVQVGTEFQSANVIAEIPGSSKADEVIVIGSHLDSWALGTGANDNGCNVSLMIDIARQMKKLGIVPQRTIRFALWNGEEIGFFGSHAYTKEYTASLDKHVMALSVDIGSGGIIGFFTNGRAELVPLLDELLKPVEAFGPYNNINVPVVGTDNFDFMLEGIPNLIGNHKSANYGQNYHAASDTYDKVDLHSLKINSAIVGAMVLGYANAPDTMIPRNRHSRAEVQEIIDAFGLEYQMRMFGVWDDWTSGERGRQ
jgi:Zn-dependent M28 family amino/carboxypeptidase